MANEVVKRLLVEIDGNVEKLRRELQKGEADVKAFAAGAVQAGRVGAAGADAVANKQANAARAIASATETIARQGKVSGEAAKQLIAQGANAALFFGPQGALVGAIGIATLAMVGMFTRVKRELEETERRTLEVMNRFAEMDVNAQAQAINRRATGDRFVGALGTSGDDLSVEALERRGLRRLEADRARLAAEVAAGAGRFRPGMGAGATTEQREEVAALADKRTQLKAVEQALAELNVVQQQQLALIGESGAAAARTALATAGLATATRTATEAERDRLLAVRKLKEEAVAVGTTFERMALAQLGSAAQVAAPFDAAIARARALIKANTDVAENLARIPLLEQWRDQAVAAAKELGRANAAIAQVDATLMGLELSEARGIATTALDFGKLTALVTTLEAELRAATAGSDAYLAVQRKLLEVEKKRQALIKDIANANVVDGKSKPAPKDPRDMADLTREIQQAVDGALQLAAAFGDVDAGVVNVLRSIGQIAGNLPALSKALSAGSGFGIVSAALPIAGALASLFGKKANPEEQRQLEELARNTEALQALTAKAGQLGLGVSGTAAQGAGADLDRFLGVPGARRTGAGGSGAREAARRAGLNLTELDAIAQQLGITLGDSYAGFIALQQALADTITKLGEFDTSLESQQAQAEAEIAIFGVTDPVEQARIRRGATAGRSSALDSVTAGLDLSTSEGREQARKNAQAVFEIMKTGDDALTDAQLGGLNGDQLLQALLDLIKGIDAIEASGAAATGSTSGTVVGLRGLTEATGSRLEDRARSLDLKASEAQRTRLDMLVALQAIVRAPLPVPSLPPGYGAARGGSTSGGGGITLVIESGGIVVNVPVTGAGGDAAAVPAAILSGLEGAIDEALYRSIRRAQVAAGDLRIAR